MRRVDRRPPDLRDHTIDEHFSESPEMRPLYDQLLKLARKGQISGENPFKEAPRHYYIGWYWHGRLFAKFYVRESLTIALAHPGDLAAGHEARLKPQCESVPSNHRNASVTVGSAKDVDEVLVSWLKNSLDTLP